MRDWCLRMAMKLFMGGIERGRISPWRHALLLLLARLAASSRQGLLVGVGVLLFDLIYVGMLVLSQTTRIVVVALWIVAHVLGALSGRSYAGPVAVGLAGLYVLLAAYDRPESLLVMIAAWLISSDSFRRWLKRKLGQVRSTLTDVQAAMFRRDVEVTR